MMIKKYILIFFVVFFHLLACGQNSNFYNANLNQNSNRLQGKLRGEVYYLNPVSNAHYFLQKEWVEGVIMLYDGDVFEGMRIRYMAYGDELVAYNNSNRLLFIVDKSIVKEFAFKWPLGNGLFKERKFVNLDSLDLPYNRTYFEELYSGSARLLAFHKVEEEKVTPYSDKNGKMYDVEYRLNTMYFIVSEENVFSRIKLKNRSLYFVYPENKKAIKKILRKSKINISDEDSAIQALMLIDDEGLLK